MKKFFYILLAAFIGAISCNVSEQIQMPEQNNDGKVTIMMKVSFPEVLVNTKGTGMDTKPNIDNLYVAVFGTQHYLNDYVKAVPCNADGTTTGASFDEIQNGTDFYFLVTLTATQSKRYVHVIANGPPTMDYNTYEEDIMKELTTTDGVGSYWTYLELDHGTANADGTVSDDAEEAFQNLKLIRNFAKVSVVVPNNLENFVYTGFKVYNTANSGSVAVWNSKTSKFFSDYYSVNDLNTLISQYPAFMPDDSFDNTAPTVGDTFNQADKFVYERQDATATRPFIIMSGRYNGENKDTYYRLDFVDNDGNYLPLYRNFEYKITINSVIKRGVDDPADAKASNANVSALDETSSLSDLSDGVSRIYVQWLDHSWMTEGTKEFKYLYLEDASNLNSYKKATIEIIDGEGDAINKKTQGDEDVTFTQSNPDPNDQGWVTVTFDTNGPGSVEKATKFRVTGHHAEGEQDHKLYRDITVRIIPTQSWTTPTVTSVTDTTLKVTFTLPSGLPSSIFPLEIEFEDNQQRLNPLGIDMPAKVAPSIVPSNNGRMSYQFVKTVSYIEYVENSSQVECVFKRLSNGSTNLYFKSEFFKDENNYVTIN